MGRPPRCGRRLLAAMLLGGLAACGGGDGAERDAATTTGPPGEDVAEAPTATDAVTIAGFAFLPGEVVVPVGGTVTWTNEDEATHSIEDRGLGVESADLARGESFDATYEEAGSYPYVCGIHNTMDGVVTVR